MLYCCIVDEYIRYNGIDNKVYCVVSVASSTNCTVATAFNEEGICGRALYKLKASSLHGDDYDFYYFYYLFKCEADVIPVYLDHKIDNEFGTYQFYHENNK